MNKSGVFVLVDKVGQPGWSSITTVNQPVTVPRDLFLSLLASFPPSLQDSTAADSQTIDTSVYQNLPAGGDTGHVWHQEYFPVLLIAAIAVVVGLFATVCFHVHLLNLHLSS